MKGGFNEGLTLSTKEILQNVLQYSERKLLLLADIYAYKERQVKFIRTVA